jgi:signal transduction histidine kinase
VVEISDDGPGIPQDIQSRMFEQFFTTKAVGKGTGLGLSISYSIVVGMHKGDISFNSKPGDTRFEIRLPI